VRDPSNRLILAFALVVAAILRLWGIGFGLPLTLAHPDESRVNYEGIRVLSGHFNPGFFNYPSLFMYALGLTDAGYCASGVVFGTYASIRECAASWRTGWEPFFLAARLLSAVAGTATVFLVYRLGGWLFDTATGLAAALFLAVAFLHVRDSHFGVTDVAMTALLTAALILLVRVSASSFRGFAVAGFVAGLATSTKYNAVLLTAAAAVRLGLLWREERRAGALFRGATAWVLAMVAGFVVGTPYALANPVRFWTDASAEAAHLRLGHAIYLGIGWQYHFVVTLWYGLTWPLLVSALIGTLWMAIRVPRRAALLLAFPVVYYAVAGRGQSVFARYMIPMVPFLCVTAGYCASSLARVISAKLPETRATLLCGVIVAIVATPSAMKACQLDRVFNRTDSRVLVADWVADHVQEGASIFVTGSYYGRPDFGRRHRRPFYSLVELESDTFYLPSGAPIERPEWFIVQESPLTAYSSVPQVVSDTLRYYQLAQTFRAIDMRTEHVFDQQDALFVPLAGFARVGRPGPNFYIYRRIK